MTQTPTLTATTTAGIVQFGDVNSTAAINGPGGSSTNGLYVVVTADSSMTATVTITNVSADGTALTVSGAGISDTFTSNSKSYSVTISAATPTTISVTKSGNALTIVTTDVSRTGGGYMYQASGEALVNHVGSGNAMNLVTGTFVNSSAYSHWVNRNATTGTINSNGEFVQTSGYNFAFDVSTLTSGTYAIGYLEVARQANTLGTPSGTTPTPLATPTPTPTNTPTHTPATYTLSLQQSGAWGGTAMFTGAGTYSAGSSPAISVTTFPDGVFAQWEDTGHAPSSLVANPYSPSTNINSMSGNYVIYCQVN